MKHQPPAAHNLKGRDRFIELESAKFSQGLLHYLSMSQPAQVGRCFGGWLRTMNTQQCPSEAVTAQALRRTWPAFLRALPQTHFRRKFRLPWLAPARRPFFDFFKNAA
jgi:hypothetical protein